uniref:Uncharacterized protein n=1 Tax=Rhizophora mucronata TaxID=61149 RepID=A0A2P2L9C3_RHIMU
MLLSLHSPGMDFESAVWLHSHQSIHLFWNIFRLLISKVLSHSFEPKVIFIWLHLIYVCSLVIPLALKLF